MIDSTVISKAKKGDKEAFKFLYDNLKTRWYMICLRYMSNRTDADDALQNALVNIFSKIKQFDESKGEFSAWSSRIVVNDCIMLLRKLNKRMQDVEVEEDWNIHDPGESVLDAMSRKELMTLIQKLPDGYRIVFNMFVIEGYSHQEIAETLNISVGTSKSQLFKAKKMLKQALEILI